MIDLNLLREKPHVFREALTARQMDHAPVDEVLKLDEQRRALIQQSEVLKAERNAVSRDIGRMRDQAERQEKIDAMRLVGDRIAVMDEALREVDTRLNDIIAMLPNLPDPHTAGKERA